MFRSIATSLVLCLVTATAQAALLSRAGGLAYYDDMLDVTWAADANLSRTQGFDADGIMDFADALSWIATLNDAAYLGGSQWRLPVARPVNGATFSILSSFNGTTDQGYNLGAPGTLYAGSTASELAHMYYTTLGNSAYYNISGGGSGGNCFFGPAVCLGNTGPFANLQSRGYWTGTQIPGAGIEAYRFTFNFDQGWQEGDTAGNATDNLVWAVIDGDPLAVVPVPASVWLFGSTLGVMGWMRRKVAS